MDRIYPDWIEAFCEYTSHSEMPKNFQYWVAVSTIAGALRKRVRVEEAYYTWYPNFFIVLVAPAGVVAKSTAANLGMNLLKKLDYIKFGPKSVTWPSLVQSMADSSEEYPIPGTADFQPMSAITIVASELGVFFDPRNHDFVNVLTDLWDGQDEKWDKATKNNGSDIIENPWINIIGGTTPSWVADNCTEYFIGGGFASRTIFVYADKKRNIVAYPSRHIPADFEDRKRALIHDLEAISELCGKFEITEEAYVWGTAWYKKLSNEGSPHLYGEKFDAYLARKQTHVHKTAMVIAASRRNELTINLKDLQDAVAAVTANEQEMPHVFDVMYRNPQMNIAQEILETIKRERKIQKTKLYRKFMRQLNFEAYESVLTSLVHSDQVSSKQIGGDVYITEKRGKE